MGNKDITFMHDINLIHSKNKELINDILFNQKIKKCFENASYEFTVKTSIIASCEPLYRSKAKDRNCRLGLTSEHLCAVRRVGEHAELVRRGRQS